MKKTAKVIAFMTAAAMVLSTAACASGTGKPASQAADTTARETGTTTAEVASQKAEGGDAQAAAGGHTYKIGVLQLVQHTALDAANEGFIAALNDAGIKYEVDQQNASGDQSTCVTVASKFANDKKDLILAIQLPQLRLWQALFPTLPYWLLLLQILLSPDWWIPMRSQAAM